MRMSAVRARYPCTKTGGARPVSFASVAGTSNSVLALAPNARPTGGLWGPAEGARFLHRPVAARSRPICQRSAAARLRHPIASRWWRGPMPADTRRSPTGLSFLAGGRGSAVRWRRLHVLPWIFMATASAAGRTIGSRRHLAGSGSTVDFDVRALPALWLADRGSRWRSASGKPRRAARGRALTPIVCCSAGGHARNDLLVGLYADATGSTVVEPKAPDVVLLGSAMLAGALRLGLARALPPRRCDAAGRRGAGARAGGQGGFRTWEYLPDFPRNAAPAAGDRGDVTLMALPSLAGGRWNRSR